MSLDATQYSSVSLSSCPIRPSAHASQLTAHSLAANSGFRPRPVCLPNRCNRPRHRPPNSCRGFIIHPPCRQCSYNIHLTKASYHTAGHTSPVHPRKESSRAREETPERALRAAVTGGSSMGLRVVAGTYTVLGLAVACFALYAIALDPATFHHLQLQMMKELDQHPPEQGQTDCAATAAEAMNTRADAVVLLLFGAAPAFMAMAAVAATSRLCIFLVLCLSPFTALNLLAILAAVVRLAIGRCHGHGTYHQLLVAGYVGVAVPFGLLFVAGLVVTLWSTVICITNLALAR